MEDTLNYSILAVLIQNNWVEFVRLCGSEDEAKYQEDVVRAGAGMAPAND